MDRDRFDTLVRLFAARPSRRATIAALLGAVVLGQAPDIAGKRGNGKSKRRGKDGARGRGKARSRRKDGGNGGKGKKRRQTQRAERQVQTEAACYNGTNCTPGPGKNLGKCDFSDSATLKGKNLKGANLGSASVARGDASGATLHGANLDKTCLVDANLTGALVNSSTNMGTAIICRTTMPDGSTNNSGCNKGTNCCPTCDVEHPCPSGRVCCNGRCQAGECCVNNQQDVCPAGQTCCDRTCTDTETGLDNCGGCGVVCDGVKCCGGDCVQAPPAPLEACCADGDCPAGSACRPDNACCAPNGTVTGDLAAEFCCSGLKCFPDTPFNPNTCVANLIVGCGCAQNGTVIGDLPASDCCSGIKCPLGSQFNPNTCVASLFTGCGCGENGAVIGDLPAEFCCSGLKCPPDAPFNPNTCVASIPTGCGIG